MFSHHGLNASLNPKLLEKRLLHGSEGIFGEFRVLVHMAQVLFVEIWVMMMIITMFILMFCLVFILHCYNGRLVIVMIWRLVRH
jgi:hypothetical protein